MKLPSRFYPPIYFILFLLFISNTSSAVGDVIVTFDDNHNTRAEFDNLEDAFNALGKAPFDNFDCNWDMKITDGVYGPDLKWSEVYLNTYPTGDKCNLTISAETPGNVTIIGNTGDDDYEYCILLSDVSNVSIEGIKFEGFSHSQIQLYRCDNCLVDSCWFVNMGESDSSHAVSYFESDDCEVFQANLSLDILHSIYSIHFSESNDNIIYFTGSDQTVTFENDNNIEMELREADGTVLISDVSFTYDLDEGQEYEIEVFGNCNFTAKYNISSINTEASPVPKKFNLYQPYPNPFNPETVIKYDLPENAHIVLKIFDVLGREVRTLVNRRQNAGRYQALWDGRDNKGSLLSSGLYFCIINGGEKIRTQKLTLLK